MFISNYTFSRKTSHIAMAILITSMANRLAVYGVCKVSAFLLHSMDAVEAGI